MDNKNPREKVIILGMISPSGPLSFPSKMSFKPVKIQGHLFLSLGIFCGIFVLVTSVTISRNEGGADQAVFFELIDSIVTTGKPYTYLGPSLEQALFGGYLTKDAVNYETVPLGDPKRDYSNYFRWHTNLIFYLMAPLTGFLKTELVNYVWHTLCFILMLTIFYFEFLRETNNKLVASMFLALLIFHPNWSEALASHFYPDRIFLVGGGLLAVSLWRDQPNKWLVLLTTLLCVLISERGILISGAFFLGAGILYPRWTVSQRIKISSTGICLIAVGFSVTYFVIDNLYYSSYLPKTITELGQRISHPFLLEKIKVFLLVNVVPLGFLSLFSWRSALIAFFSMIPNMVGSVGGGEKVGWATHYHSYYFPFLAWAGGLGMCQLYNQLKRLPKGYSKVVGILTLCLVLELAVDHTSINLSHVNIRKNFQSNYLIWCINHFPKMGGSETNDAQKMRDFISKNIRMGSTISTLEAIFPYVYRYKKVRYYPLGIDTADFIIIKYNPAHSAPEKRWEGAVTYLGTNEQEKINLILYQRIKNSGFDTENPTLLPNGFALLSRKKE